jgi:hypothetical protein
VNSSQQVAARGVRERDDRAATASASSPPSNTKLAILALERERRGIGAAW